MSSDDKPVTHLEHEGRAVHIPNAEHEPTLHADDKAPIRAAIAARDPDMDPQLVWRNKRTGPLEVTAPPIYVQEHVHPKALIDDLKAGRARADNLFGHFGITDEDREAEVEFYRHTRRWSNRFILGDSLEVMTSLAEREGLRGKVQAIYVDPPYGIRFNSNFQWSTNTNIVKDGKPEHLTREPEQVRAFRDTWRDGIHSYLGYLRDRLMAARELLTESGSCFVQIGDENVHRVRVLMDEVFGKENFVSQIAFRTKIPLNPVYIGNLVDHILFYSKSVDKLKFRRGFTHRDPDTGAFNYGEAEFFEIISGAKIQEFDGELRRFASLDMMASGYTESCHFNFNHFGKTWSPRKTNSWKTTPTGVERMKKANRFAIFGQVPRAKQYLSDYPVAEIPNFWADTQGASGKSYIVQTAERVVQRCLLMATDPGDLVLDPTAGSGTTAHVAEHWGRRWIAIDTSRVALALARARVMGAKYPAYTLRDSPEGQARMEKEGWATPRAEERPRYERDVAMGFVCERVPHITIGGIANNPVIDTLWDRHHPAVEDALASLNAALRNHPEPFEVSNGGRAGSKIDFTAAGEVKMPSGEMAPANGFMEWEVPREPGSPWPEEQRKLFYMLKTQERQRDERAKDDPGRTMRIDPEQDAKSDAVADKALAELNAMRGARYTFGTLPERPMEPWPDAATEALAQFWTARIARQRAIDEAIERKGREDDYEVLHDKPFEDRKKLRVAGPFTVESLSPHRTPVTDEHGELFEEAAPAPEQDAFRDAMLENLEKAGVHQAGREDRIEFEDIATWPGLYVTAKGTYAEGETTRTAGIFLGPEYGTVARADLVEAATEAADAGCDVLIACAFNFDARAQEFRRMGRVPILHARMHPDLHIKDLKEGGGNLFAVFGEPDIRLVEEGDRLRVAVDGIDIFRPATGEVVTTSPDEIACWFVDTDYSGEAFFVRQAYFPGADVPYKSIRAALKADVDEDAWDSLKRTTSRAFPRPKGGRIAVKVVNHLGDEVMKVLRVDG